MAIVFYMPLANSLKIFYNKTIILRKGEKSMNNFFRQAHGGGVNAA